MYSCWMLCLRGAMTKFSWRRESSLTTSGSLKMDSCLVLTECLSRRILRFRTWAIDSGYDGRRVDVLSSRSIVISLYICFSGLQNGSRFIRNDSSFGSSHFCYYFSCHFVKFWKIEIAIFWREMEVGFGDHDIGSPLRLP